MVGCQQGSRDTFRKDAAMLSLPIANDPQALGDLDFRSSSISHARISALSIEHDDLDCAIDALAATSSHDDLAVVRLKKRRLQIRDEIAGLVAASQGQDAGTEGALASGAETGASEVSPRRRDETIILGVFVAVLFAMGLSWLGTDDTTL